MFEPHRCQQALLRAAYAQLVPETRRELGSGQQTRQYRQAEWAVGAERKKVG